MLGNSKFKNPKLNRYPGGFSVLTFSFAVSLDEHLTHS